MGGERWRLSRMIDDNFSHHLRHCYEWAGLTTSSGSSSISKHTDSENSLKSNSIIDQCLKSWAIYSKDAEAKPLIIHSRLQLIQYSDFQTWNAIKLLLHNDYWQECKACWKKIYAAGTLYCAYIHTYIQLQAGLYIIDSKADAVYLFGRKPFSFSTETSDQDVF